MAFRQSFPPQALGMCFYINQILEKAWSWESIFEWWIEYVFQAGVV